MEDLPEKEHKIYIKVNKKQSMQLVYEEINYE